MPLRPNLQEAMFKAKIETENRRLLKIDSIVAKICTAYAQACTSSVGFNKPYKHYINMSDDLEFYKTSLNEIVHNLRKGFPKSSINTVDMTDNSRPFQKKNKNVCILIDRFVG